MILVIFIALTLGIIFGHSYSGAINISQISSQTTYYALLLLLFIIGLEVGQNRKVWTELKKIGMRALLLPLATIAGSLLGGLLLGLIIGVKPFVALALSSGMGYYSLSSVMLKQAISSQIGMQALIIDISRELITFVFTPLLARISFLLPVTVGGATVMDTTMPIITRYTSATNTILAIISGGVITLLVPLLLSLFAYLAVH